MRPKGPEVHRPGREAGINRKIIELSAEGATLALSGFHRFC